MSDLIQSYLPVIVFLVLAMGMAGVMIGLSFVLGKQNPDSEKLSAYECGFDPFSDARHKFDVRFY